MDFALIVIGILLIIWVNWKFCSRDSRSHHNLGGFIDFTSDFFVSPDFPFLATTFSVAIGVFILDYFIPIIGAKKFGGTKTGIIGATLGLLVGLIFLGPLGFFLGTFSGAFYWRTYS